MDENRASIDWVAIERRWQAYWEKEKTFYADPDPSREGVYVQVAYPYPSGAMHIGHARTYSVADAIAKYHRLKGKNVLFPMGWHVSGTPVIAAVDALNARDEKTVRLFTERFRIPHEDLPKLCTPQRFVDYMVNEAEYGYKKGFGVLGLGIDWRRELTTIDPWYKKFITWQYHKLHQKGLVRKGRYPVRFCPARGEPVGDHDLVEGQGVGIQEFALLKLRREDGSFLVAATLRPDTVFGQTNVWVHPDAAYAEIRVDGERWVASEAFAEKIRHQRGKVVVKKKIPGRDLVGETVHAPAVEKALLVLPASFCRPDIGTGIVTSVPSEAPVDYVALLELQRDEETLRAYGLDAGRVRAIQPVPIIQTPASAMLAVHEVKKRGIRSQNEEEALQQAKQKVYKESFHQGVLNERNGPFSGKPVRTAQKAMRAWLYETGKAEPYYELEGPVVARGGFPCVVRVLDDQWFIKYSDEAWKKESLKTLEGMEIVPAFFRAQYEHVFAWLEDKPCTRSKGLGTPFPWDEEKIIEPLGDSTIYMAYFTIAHQVRALDAERLNEAFFDYVFLGKGSAEEAARAAGAKPEQVKAMRESFLYWYPLAYNVSALELIPNHMAFSIFHHTAIFPKDKRQRGTLNLGMLLLEGEKMSSSKGNVMLINDICEEIGADLVRFFLLNATEPWEEMDWRSREVKKGLAKMRGLLQRFLALQGIPPASLDAARLPPAQRWLLARFRAGLNRYLKAMEAFSLRKALQPLSFDLARDLKWYDQRKSVAEDDAGLLRYLAHRWARCMAPVMPHVCEEIWQHSLGQKGSVFDARLPGPEKEDESVLASEELVRQTLQDIQQVQALARVNAKSARLFVAAAWKHALARAVFAAGPHAGQDEVIRKAMQEESVRAHGKQAARLARAMLGRYAREPLPPDTEYAALQQASASLEKMTGLEITVAREQDAQGPARAKAAGALPQKPAIYLE